MILIHTHFVDVNISVPITICLTIVAYHIYSGLYTYFLYETMRKVQNIQIICCYNGNHAGFAHRIPAILKKIDQPLVIINSDKGIHQVCQNQCLFKLYICKRWKINMSQPYFWEEQIGFHKHSSLTKSKTRWKVSSYITSYLHSKPLFSFTMDIDQRKHLSILGFLAMHIFQV